MFFKSHLVRVRSPLVFLLLLLIGPGIADAQRDAKRTVNRARAPNWNAARVRSIFFADAFAEGLVGERPANWGRAVASPRTPMPGVRAGGGVPDPRPSVGASGTYAWSKVISPEVLEDEIKQIKLQVDQQVTTPAAFAGGGYRVVRRHFSLLATLLAIIAEYDGDVRWRSDAAAARDLFAHTAANAKVGSIQVFNEAKQRKLDLEDLVRGTGIQGSPAGAKTDWSRICDRSPLMQRLETGQQQKLMPWTAAQSEFRANGDQLRHEAEIFAAIGEVLTKEGMEDGDDGDYAGYSHQLRDAAREIVEAVRLNNHEQARQAVGNIGKSCSQCHETYRG